MLASALELVDAGHIHKVVSAQRAIQVCPPAVQEVLGDDPALHRLGSEHAAVAATKVHKRVRDARY